MNDLAQLSIEQFLDNLAERTPTPGGGSTAALAGAVACAMTRMVAAYAVSPNTNNADRETMREFGKGLKHLDQLLRALISMDASAYENVTAIARSAGKNTPAHEMAVLNAIAVPLEIAALASQTLAVMDEFKEKSSRYLASDLGVAAVLGEATVRAATYSVKVNLPDLSDTSKRERIQREINAIGTHAADRQQSIENYVRQIMAARNA